jgi:autotransporter strand-loop-strand O-heptosyltransferase
VVDARCALNRIEDNVDAQPMQQAETSALSQTSAPTSGSSASAPSGRPAFPGPAAAPTQEGPKGIRYDFNLGARVVVPEGSWRVQLRDLDTGNILFDTRCSASFINSSKRFFVRFGVEVWEHEESVFRHEYSAERQEVLIQFPVGTLGDTMAWFPYAARFAEVNGCKLTCALSALIAPLLKDQYPHITFVTHEEVVERKLQDSFYASYCLGLFFDDTANVWQPTDFRMVGLHRTAGYILGVDPTEAPPKITIPDDPRPIPEP